MYLTKSLDFGVTRNKTSGVGGVQVFNNALITIEERVTSMAGNNKITWSGGTGLQFFTR